MSNVHIKSCNVNEEDGKWRTPLHVAMIFARDELCELLLKQGVTSVQKIATVTVQYNLLYTMVDTN